MVYKEVSQESVQKFIDRYTITSETIIYFHKDNILRSGNKAYSFYISHLGRIWNITYDIKKLFPDYKAQIDTGSLIMDIPGSTFIVNALNKKIKINCDYIEL